MANRSTLHISHLPKLKMWLEDQGWELQPLTDHGYEVLRAKRTPVIRRQRPQIDKTIL